MRVLVWQWGKRGAGPRYAAELAESLRRIPGAAVTLSLSSGAEIMAGPDAPRCEMPVPTYAGLGGFARRVLAAPGAIGPLARRLRALRLDIAICAMPGPLDLLMAAALRRAGVPMLVVVHDADAHPGDGLPFQMTLQRRLVTRSQGVIALTAHVAERLRAQCLAGMSRTLFPAALPPFRFGAKPPPPGAQGGPMRLLSFGRLLPYKGLDLLAEAVARLPQEAPFALRVVGQGPESAPLAALRAAPGVTVENRWVPEEEVGRLLAWADALVLPYREASQSGVAAAAIAAGRWIVSTDVGGLREQLGGYAGAVLCPPDAASLAAAIAALLRDPPAAPGADGAADPRVEWHQTNARLYAALEAAFAGKEHG